MRHHTSDQLEGAPRLRVGCRPETHVLDTGFHKHRCRSCETTWMHADAVMDQCSKPALHTAHECPHCGRPEFDRYHHTFDDFINDLNL